MGGFPAQVLQSRKPVLKIEDTMKLSIEAELLYNFADDTQVIANLEASRTSDQIILSRKRWTSSRRPTFFPKTTPYGDRSIRASLSGDVSHPAIRPWSKTTSGSCFHKPACNMCGPKSFPAKSCRSLVLRASRFCPSDPSSAAICATKEFSGAGDGVARGSWRESLNGLNHRNVDYVAGVSDAETTADSRRKIVEPGGR